MSTMWKLRRNKSLMNPKPAICMAHRQASAELENDNETFVRKDVFNQYAKRMDERCGSHEDAIKAVEKKVDKNSQLLTGLVISMLLVFVGLLVDILRGALT